MVGSVCTCRPTCPLKASMMKCNAWGWTHSIHFCTTWFPFWSLTHFNTWPSSSLTISLWTTGDNRGSRDHLWSDPAWKHFQTSPTFFTMAPGPTNRSCLWTAALEKSAEVHYREMNSFLSQTRSLFTIPPPQTISCGCWARFFFLLPAVQHLHINSGTISFIQGWWQSACEDPAARRGSCIHKANMQMKIFQGSTLWMLLPGKQKLVNQSNAFPILGWKKIFVPGKKGIRITTMLSQYEQRSNWVKQFV